MGEVSLNGDVLAGIAVSCCILGFFLNSTYAKKYGEPAIQWIPFAFQFICSGAVLSQIPGNEVSVSFIILVTSAIASYAIGLWVCRQHTKKKQTEPGDTVCAMAAQAVLPFGAALAFMIFAGMILFGFVWAH